MLCGLIVCASLCAEPGPNIEDVTQVSIPPNAVERVVRFRPLGRVKTAREYFIEDERIGRREFYDNRNVAVEMLYRDGKLHGLSRQFYLSAKLYAERPYRNGVMHGEFKFWDEEGTLMGASRIENGTGLLREFKQPNTSSIDAETPYRDSRKHGKVKTWGNFADCEGLGFQASNYIEGRLEGPSVVRHGDGLLLSWSWFSNGDLHGQVTHLTRDGQVGPGYPVYFVRGRRVTELEMKDAAERDPELAKTLTFRPETNEPVPESPSQAFNKKKAAAKAKSVEARN